MTGIWISHVLISHTRFRRDSERIGESAFNGMNDFGTIGRKGLEAPLLRLYLRPDEAARAIGVSRRTLSAWQSARVIGFRRVGRTVLFSVADIQTAIDRYRVTPIGELSPCRQQVDPSTITAPIPPIGSESIRKRRMQRVAPVPATK